MKIIKEDDYGFKNGDRYYGGLPAEPDMPDDFVPASKNANHIRIEAGKTFTIVGRQKSPYAGQKDRHRYAGVNDHGGACVLTMGEIRTYSNRVYFDNVHLAEDFFEKFIEKFGNRGIKFAITKVSATNNAAGEEAILDTSDCGPYFRTKISNDDKPHGLIPDRNGKVSWPRNDESLEEASKSAKDVREYVKEMAIEDTDYIDSGIENYRDLRDTLKARGFTVTDKQAKDLYDTYCEIYDTCMSDYYDDEDELDEAVHPIKKKQVINAIKHASNNDIDVALNAFTISDLVDACDVLHHWSDRSDWQLEALNEDLDRRAMQSAIAKYIVKNDMNTSPMAILDMFPDSAIKEVYKKYVAIGEALDEAHDELSHSNAKAYTAKDLGNALLALKGDSINYPVYVNDSEWGDEEVNNFFADEDDKRVYIGY